MIVKNEEASLMMISLKNMPEAIQEYGRAFIKLIPGCNEIPESTWEAIKIKFPIINMKVKDKLIVEVATKKKRKEKIIEEPTIVKDKEGQETVVMKKVPKKYDGIESTEFEDLSVEKQEELIKDTWNKRTLNKWRKKEIEPSVRLAIDDKLKKIENRRKEAEYEKNKNKK